MDHRALKRLASRPMPYPLLPFRLLPSPVPLTPVPASQGALTYPSQPLCSPTLCIPYHCCDPPPAAVSRTLDPCSPIPIPALTQSHTPLLPFRLLPSPFLPSTAVPLCTAVPSSHISSLKVCRCPPPCWGPPIPVPFTAYLFYFSALLHFL
jgi:hypothetical protein